LWLSANRGSGPSSRDRSSGVSQKVRHEVALRSAAAVRSPRHGRRNLTGSRAEGFWGVSAVIFLVARTGAVAMHIADVNWNLQYKHDDAASAPRR
jgi:hypothetical protein